MTHNFGRTAYFSISTVYFVTRYEERSMKCTWYEVTWYEVTWYEVNLVWSAIWYEVHLVWSALVWSVVVWSIFWDEVHRDEVTGMKWHFFPLVWSVTQKWSAGGMKCLGPVQFDYFLPSTFFTWDRPLPYNWPSTLDQKTVHYRPEPFTLAGPST